MVRADAVEIFSSAVSSVQPAQLLPKHLSLHDDILSIGGQSIPLSAKQNIYVIGAGKAAAAMAVETGKILGEYISDGVVVTKYLHSLHCHNIEILEAAHPVPDENGIKAVKKTLQLLQNAGKDDIVVCLVSGGASALWCDLPEGISLRDMQTTFSALLKSGAAIDEMNIVRKHLSTIKGGQLINYCNGANVFSLMISDVPGDRLDVIASGPSVADPSTFGDAYHIFEKFGLVPGLPPGILTYMNNGKQGIIPETPKPGESLFNHTVNTIIGSNSVALKAAAGKAESKGYHVLMVPDLVTGDVEKEAKILVDLASQYKGPLPVCILQGGETTVRVTGNGKGGRNQHFALCALKELKDRRSGPGISILSGGTDGSDGPTDAAGAIADKDVITRAEDAGLSIDDYIVQNNAYHFFEQTDSLLKTGPTQTNVMDIMMAIVK